MIFAQRSSTGRVSSPWLGGRRTFIRAMPRSRFRFNRSQVFRGWRRLAQSENGTVWPVSTEADYPAQAIGLAPPRLVGS